MAMSQVIVLIITLQAFCPQVLASRTQMHLGTRSKTNQVRAKRFLDIDSEMSALLAQSGVIREDVINKPGNKYSLKVETGAFKRNPFLHGTFKFTGWYGGTLAGGSAAGLPGMVAGGAAGMTAGDRAAEMLSRILQGQGSIGISDDWKEKHSQPNVVAPTNFQPVFPASPVTLPTHDEVKKEQTLMSSIQNILSMGNRSSPLVNSIVSDTSKNPFPTITDAQPHAQPTGFMSSLFRPYRLQQDTDRKVIFGLETALHSDDQNEVENAKITTLLMEILRRQEDGVEVVVE